MHVDIVENLNDLEALQGAVVVLDIFRASNTIISLLAAGAEEVVLLAGLEEARRLRARQPGWLLWGERQGVTPPDFDGGNSPVAAGRGGLSGRRVILTTSAGTQAVGRLQGAQAVFFGSFANAAALAAALARLDPPAVHLLPMGLEARTPALEDELAARYLAGLLAGEPRDFPSLLPRLLDCAGARRLRRLGQEDDLAFCTTLDSHTVIPRVHFGQWPAARAARP